MISPLPVCVDTSEEVLYQFLGEESVLLDIQSGIYFGLDKVGSQMWELLTEHRDTETVVDLLLERYEVEEERLRADLATLVQELADAKLVTVADS